MTNQQETRSCPSKGARARSPIGLPRPNTKSVEGLSSRVRAFLRLRQYPGGLVCATFQARAGSTSYARMLSAVTQRCVPTRGSQAAGQNLGLLLRPGAIAPAAPTRVMRLVLGGRDVGGRGLPPEYP